MNEIQTDELFELLEAGRTVWRKLYKNTFQDYIEVGRITDGIITKRLIVGQDPWKFLYHEWMVSESTIRKSRDCYLIYADLLKARPELFEQKLTKLIELIPDLKDKTEEEKIEAIEAVKELSVSDTKELRREAKQKECEHEWEEIKICKLCKAKKKV